MKSLAVSAAGVPWGLDNSKAEASLGKVVGLEDGGYQLFLEIHYCDIFLVINSLMLGISFLDVNIQNRI